MISSEARISANKLNAERSTGPRTETGKERSRRNSLKHGMTGAGIVLIEADAAEVERRTAVYADELVAVGEVGQAVARSAALNSVRMERGTAQQKAALSVRVRQVEADFVPPDDVDDVEADRLRLEAVQVAMFDPSREASLARQYQASAERGFFRALKELRQMFLQDEVLAKAQKAEDVDAMMGSFLAHQKSARDMDEQFDALYPEMKAGLPDRLANSSYFPRSAGVVDVPIAIGRPR